MQGLEKILEEIEQKKEKCLNIVKVEVEPIEITIHRERYKGLCMAEEIIRKHMNDSWIPVEERLPEKEYYTALCVTDKNHYCVAVYNREYGFRTGDIDAEGEIIAWMPLPEPYRPEPLEKN